MKADRKFIRLDECKVLSAPYQHARTIAFLPQQGYLPKHEKINKLETVTWMLMSFPIFMRMMKLPSRVWNGVSPNFPEVNGDIWKLSCFLLGNAKFVLLDEPFDYLSFHLVDKLIGLIKKTIRKRKG